MSKTILGIDCKAYRNAGTYASPSWNEVPNMADPTLTLESTEAVVTTREGGGWELVIAAIKKAGLAYKMIWDPTDTDWVALRDAWLNKTPVEFLILDGAVGTSGSQGLRAGMTVLKFTRSEGNAEAAMSDVEIKPTRFFDASGNAVAPSWYIAA